MTTLTPADFGAAQLTLPFDDFTSSDCLEGWDTVLGYFHKVNPEACMLVAEDAEATLRDGYWLAARCRKLGLDPIKVAAPPILLRQGIFTVNSYPVDLLRERLG